MPKVKKNEEKSPTIHTPRKTNSRKTMDSSKTPVTTPKTPIRRTKISQAVCADQCKMIESITPRRSTRHREPSSTTKPIEITPKTRIIKSATKSSIKKKGNELQFLSPEPPKSVKKIADKKSASKFRQTFHASSTTSFVNDDNEKATKSVYNVETFEDINQDEMPPKAKTPSKKSSRETTIIKREDLSFEDVKSSRQTMDDLKSPDLSEEDKNEPEEKNEILADAESNTKSRKSSRKTMIVSQPTIQNEEEENDKNVANDASVIEEIPLKKSSRKTMIVSPNHLIVGLEGAESTSKKVVALAPDETNSKTLSRKSFRQTVITSQATILTEVEENDKNVTNDGEVTEKTPQSNSKTLTRKSSRKTMINSPTNSIVGDKNDKPAEVTESNVKAIEKTPLKKSSRKTMIVSPNHSIAGEKNDVSLKGAESQQTMIDSNSKSSRETMMAPQQTTILNVEGNAIDKNVTNEVTEKTPESNSKTLTRKSSRKTMSKPADSSVAEENDEIIAASKMTPRKSTRQTMIVTQPDENDSILADAATKKTNISKNRCSLIVGSRIKDDNNYRSASIHKMSTHEYEELLQDDNSGQNVLLNNEAGNVESCIEKKNDSAMINENTDANENDEIIENTTFELKSPKNGRNSIRITKTNETRHSLTVQTNTNQSSPNRTFELNASNIPANTTFEMNTSKNTPSKIVAQKSESIILQNNAIESIKKSAAIHTIDLTDTPGVPRNIKNFGVIDLIDTPSPSVPSTSKLSAKATSSKSALTPFEIAKQFKVKKVSVTPMSSVKKTPKRLERTPKKIDTKSSSKHVKSNLMPAFAAETAADRTPKTAIRKTPKRLQRTPCKLDNLVKSATKIDFIGDSKIFDKKIKTMILSPNVLSSPLKGIRKRSFSVTEQDKKNSVRFNDNLENIKIIENRPMLRSQRTQSQSDVTAKHKKIPDFSAIHLKMQEKMESITDYEVRKLRRHVELSASKVLQAKINNKSKANEPAAQKSLFNKVSAPSATKSSTSSTLFTFASSSSSSTSTTTMSSIKTSKVDDRRNKCKNLYKKTAAGTDCDSSTTARSEMLKGVRLNRRFDLQMKYRNNLE